MTQTTDKPTNLNVWTYDRIKQMILKNDLTVGDQIKIEDLAAEFGVSRTPIREALIRLKEERFVEVRPRCGFYVASISLRELQELFELRRIFECYAAEHCISRLSDDQKKDIHWHHEQSKSMMRQHKPREFNYHEICLHNIIVESINNEAFKRMWESISDQIYRQRCVSMESEENQRKSIEEHESFINAIMRGDAQGARSFMYIHLSNVEDRLIRYMYGNNDL